MSVNPAAPSASSSPDEGDGHAGSTPSATGWLADAAASLRYDVVMFARTAVAMSLAPRRFAAEWREGQRRALNPVAFLGTALAVGSLPTLLVNHFVPRAGDGGPFAAFFADQVMPYIQYTLLGLMAHGLLHLLGGRQRLLATVGVALFAGGGPAMLVDLATVPLDLMLGQAAASADTAANAVIAVLTTASIAAANLAFFVSFAQGLAGLHGVRLWRPVLALVGAYVVLAGLRIGYFKLTMGGL
jgi:hypothetical protein